MEPIPGNDDKPNVSLQRRKARSIAAINNFSAGIAEATIRWELSKSHSSADGAGDSQLSGHDVEYVLAIRTATGRYMDDAFRATGLWLIDQIESGWPVSRALDNLLTEADNVINHEERNWIEHLREAGFYDKTGPGWNVFELFDRELRPRAQETHRRMRQLILTYGGAETLSPIVDLSTAVNPSMSRPPQQTGIGAERPRATPHKESGRPKGPQVNGAKLKELRGTFSQEDFADKCGVDIRTYQRGEASGTWALTTFDKVSANLTELLERSFSSDVLMLRQK
jgi:hypothetical protein